MKAPVTRPKTHQSLKPPSWLCMALEGRAVIEWGSYLASWPVLKNAPKGDGHPVLVLPGLGTGDRSTYPFRRYRLSFHFLVKCSHESVNHWCCYYFFICPIIHRPLVVAIYTQVVIVKRSHRLGVISKIFKAQYRNLVGIKFFLFAYHTHLMLCAAGTRITVF